MTSRATIDRLRQGLLRVRDWDYLRKWLVLGALIGIVAGAAAIAFIHAIELASAVLLEGLGGYEPPLPRGEGNRLTDGEFARPWAIPLVVGLGALISGLLVFRFAPEAEGHGTDAAIDAIHHNPRSIRPRVPIVKLLASAATIGSGGSAGREGPTAQISAGFGSLLARRLDLSPQDARIAVAVGCGAGIGAIFRAPLGGAVLGTEILYREDLEPDALLPSLVASIVGFSLFGASEGFTPIFGTVITHRFDHPIELIYYAALGIAAGLVGRAYARTFYGTIGITKRLRGAVWLKPALAGVLVGLIGLAVPQVLATGYGWIQLGMIDGLRDEALWLILLLPALKILATSLSIGSGGSGGIFGPGMVIGGFVGLALWRLLDGVAPGVPDVAPFMVVGMMACFGSVAHAPLGLMLMVAEMTGSLVLLPPAMLAIGIAAVVVGDESIYRSQLRSRADAPGHRARFGMPLLVSTPVREVMRRPRLVAAASSSLASTRVAMHAADLTRMPVVAGDRFVGVVRERDGAADLPTAGTAADTSYPTVSPDATLDEALDAMVSAGVNWVPVVDHQRLVGVLAMSEVIGGYQTVLRRMLRRLAGIHGRAALLELSVGEGSAVVGSRLDRVPWPAGCVAVSVDRDGSLVAPAVDTELREGDVVVVVAPASAEPTVRALFGDSGAPSDPVTPSDEG